MRTLGEAYRLFIGRRLAFTAVLVFCNLGNAVQCFTTGDWKRGIYWCASALCILMVAL